MSNEIVLYTADNCPNCVNTKNWLDNNGLEYRTVDITVSESGRSELRALGFTTLPVVRVTQGGRDVDSWGGLKLDKLKSLLLL